MTIDEFINGLAARHDWEGKEFVLNDVRGKLTGYSMDQLDRIFDRYLGAWDKGYPPRVPHILQFAKDVYATSHGDAVFFWRCECGQLYSLVGCGCPACHSTVAEGVLEGSSETDHIPCQANCYQCPEYLKPHCYGPRCDTFATMERPGDICRDCVCRSCCATEKRLREAERAATSRRGIDRAREIFLKVVAAADKKRSAA